MLKEATAGFNLSASCHVSYNTSASNTAKSILLFLFSTRCTDNKKINKYKKMQAIVFKRHNRPKSAQEVQRTTRTEIKTAHPAGGEVTAGFKSSHDKMASDGKWWYAAFFFLFFLLSS